MSAVHGDYTCSVLADTWMTQAHTVVTHAVLKAEAVAPKFLPAPDLDLDLEPSSADTQLPDLAYT